MKWVYLVIGLFLCLFGWLLMLIGRGITYDHGGYTAWDSHFDAAYRDCCFVVDLRTALPFFVIGVIMILISIGKFVSRR